MPGQRGYIFPPFPKGRKFYRDNANTIIKVPPEFVLSYRVLDAAPQRPYQANIRRSFAHGPEGLKCFVPEKVKKSNLHGWREPVDFFKEEGPSLRSLDESPRGDRHPPFVPRFQPEELFFSQ